MLLFWYRVFYGFCWLLTLLPLRVLYLFSDILFLIVCYIVRYRRKVVYENLRNSFPEKSEKERRRIARKFYRFFCDLFIEILKITNFSKAQLNRRIHYTNPEIYEDLYKKGKQVFFIIGHYCNWEWLSALEGATPYHQASLYLPLRNKLFDKFFYDLRMKYGTEVIPTKNTVRYISKYLQEQRLTALCFLADQSPHRDHIHHWVTFLNQDTPVFLGAEKLAKRYGMAIVYYELRRVKRGYYEVEIIPVTENAAETTEHEITEKHVRLLEKTIRNNPQYWLWSHRRWKHKRS